jgi:hypothetical protein
MLPSSTLFTVASFPLKGRGFFLFLKREKMGGTQLKEESQGIKEIIYFEVTIFFLSSQM